MKIATKGTALVLTYGILSEVQVHATTRRQAAAPSVSLSAAAAGMRARGRPSQHAA